MVITELIEQWSGVRVTPAHRVEEVILLFRVMEGRREALGIVENEEQELEVRPPGLLIQPVRERMETFHYETDFIMLAANDAICKGHGVESPTPPGSDPKIGSNPSANRNRPSSRSWLGPPSAPCRTPPS